MRKGASLGHVRKIMPRTRPFFLKSTEGLPSPQKHCRVLLHVEAFLVFGFFTRSGDPLVFSFLSNTPEPRCRYLHRGTAQREGRK